METAQIDEMVSSLFTNDSLIESEYFKTLRRTQHLEPEKHLMLGVLKDAVESFLDNINARNGKRMRQFQSDEKWFFEENTPWTFSFETICGVLGLDPGYIRKGLRQREREESLQMLAKVHSALSFSENGEIRRMPLTRSYNVHQNRRINRRRRHARNAAESA